MRNYPEREVTQFAEMLRPEQLLQSGHIRVAEKIPDPESIPMGQLMNLWLLGEGYLSNRYNLVAFTQFSERTMSLVGADPAYSRIIYGSSLEKKNPFYAHRGQLLINPELSVVKNEPTFALPQGCGSIRNAKIRYIGKHPTNAWLTAYAWKPGDPKPIRISQPLRDLSAAYTQHECRHLDGLDVTHFPDTLLDMTKPDDVSWKITQDILLGMPTAKEYVQTAYKEEGLQAWLIFQEGRLKVYDAKSRTLSPFY